jgi:SAM-dependent methyltransferase
MPAPITTRGAFAQWWRESSRRIGRWHTLTALIASLFGLLRDYTPARRRMRYGDLDFDWDNRVDTTWSNVRFGTRLREILAGRPYQPTEPELFREMVAGLGIDFEQFTFVDLGSGKGRAVLLATEFPFGRLIGVELLPELHAIAQENGRRFQGGAQTHRIELLCGDARQFECPATPLVVFLFDPFPEHILEEVIAKLERSVREHPRRVIVVYQNPISEHVLSNAGWLRRSRGDIRCAIYEGEEQQNGLSS